ncbi:hypothetical protein AGABI2DRAFT_210004, partial [Agaricus bisporus var. bisporus H97]|uniref:hypothetical protein n=1 Tax=Agaricus bisporus var. bisporus (strain H97 / ATCC MYA-4626 / FGSC 10389) TaxID=936046 RepID=UPI00029F7690
MASPRRPRFSADLSQCLFDFVIQLLPPPDELHVKENVRRLLQRLIRNIQPNCRLLAFGSTANGFSLRNSDMDLCCLIDSPERLNPADLVTILGDLLERETRFHVKPLPHARIPIVKLSLDPSPGLPSGIACDIGFENRLAIENTRLLLTYAKIDPTRVRTLVLFLKIWSKRRKINSPYKGTLSSYGYVLLVIYFLVHVKNPPVLPNLQQMPPLRPINKDDTTLNGYNVWFFDDTDILCQRWQSENTESVAELHVFTFSPHPPTDLSPRLIDFFRYFSRDFSYNTGVASIRAGLLKKDAKGWQNDVGTASTLTVQISFLLLLIILFLCQSRSAKLSIPPQTPYSIGTQSRRMAPGLSPRMTMSPHPTYVLQVVDEHSILTTNKKPPVEPVNVPLPPSPTSDTIPLVSTNTPHIASPVASFSNTIPTFVPQSTIPAQPHPEHMAPRRSKWTSPPPADASFVDRTMYENSLGRSLELATAPVGEARERYRCRKKRDGEDTWEEEEEMEMEEEDDVGSV